MSEQETRASHEEVEQFMGKLRGFYGGLQTSAERAMLATILEGAQAGETSGYGGRFRLRYGDPEEGGGSESSSGWNDLVGWMEGQGEDDTQGFAVRYR